MVSLPVGKGVDVDRVMFFVWSWPGEVHNTIIPDGFGTHGGEGGAGLSTVLGLIRFYDVPLTHVVMVRHREWFSELAHEGNLTPQMFAVLKGAIPYNWDYYPAEEARLLKQGRDVFLEFRRWKFRLTGIWQK